jgi:hypothetical protein
MVQRIVETPSDDSESVSTVRHGGIVHAVAAYGKEKDIHKLALGCVVLPRPRCIDPNASVWNQIRQDAVQQWIMKKKFDVDWSSAPGQR